MTGDPTPLDFDKMREMLAAVPALRRDPEQHASLLAVIDWLEKAQRDHSDD